MKKFLVLLFSIMLLCGCNNEKKLKEEEKIKNVENNLQKITDEFAEKIGEQEDKLIQDINDTSSLGKINNYYLEQEKYYREELISYCKILNESNLNFEKLNERITDYEKYAKLHYTSNKMYWEELSKTTSEGSMAKLLEKEYLYKETYIKNIKENIAKLKTKKINITEFKEKIKVLTITMGYSTDIEWQKH